MTCIYNLLEIEKEGVGCLNFVQYITHFYTEVPPGNCVFSLG